MTITNQIKSLGVLTFSDEGVLFVGDNVSGTIHAIDFTAESRTANKFEINVYNIDAQIAAILGTTQNNVQLNDLAVHPKSGEVYLSVTRGHGADTFDTAITLAELKKQGIDLGLNVYSEAKYIGPNPPMGTHKYYFRIYALSVPSLDLDKPTRNTLIEEIKDNIIAYGELIGTYKL